MNETNYEFEVEYTLSDCKNITFYTGIIAETKDDAIQKVLDRYKNKIISIKNCICRWKY